MKTHYFALIILTFCVGSFILSCTGNPVSDSLLQKGESELERQLNHAMARTKSGDGLLLESYTKRTDISSNNDIIGIVNEILDANADIIVDGCNNNFIFATVGENHENMRYTYEELSAKIGPGMSVYDLYWSYNGETYSSVAVASDELGIIYDNIGRMALYFEDIPRLDSDELLLSYVDSLPALDSCAAGDSCVIGEVILESRYFDWNHSGYCYDAYNNQFGMYIFFANGSYINDIITSLNTQKIFDSYDSNCLISGDITVAAGGEGQATATIMWTCTYRIRYKSYYDSGTYVITTSDIKETH